MKDDAISRQAVLKLLSTMPPEEAITKAMLIQSVKQMDAAQLGKRTGERTETHACDLIDRRAAIDAIEKHIRTAEEPYQLTDADKVMNHAFEIAASCVYNLSAAQPERKKGKWIDYTEDGYVECPFCHNATNCDGNKDELHFCFSCGADMREVIE